MVDHIEQEMAEQDTAVGEHGGQPIVKEDST